jgi:hypothetical protein
MERVVRCVVCKGKGMGGGVGWRSVVVCLGSQAGLGVTGWGGGREGCVLRLRSACGRAVNSSARWFSCYSIRSYGSTSRSQIFLEGCSLEWSGGARGL